MPRVINPNDKRLRANRQSSTVRSAMLLSNAQNSRVTDNDTYRDPEATAADHPMQVTHAHYGRFPVYKLTTHGCVRLEINAQSLGEVLSQPHYSDVCFDCGRSDCLYETTIPGERSTNQCDGKASRMSRICPEPSCRKRIFDSQPTGAFLEEEFAKGTPEGEDPLVIQDDSFANSSPESRTRSVMSNHIVGYHSDLARELGLGKAPELPRLAVV